MTSEKSKDLVLLGTPQTLGDRKAIPCLRRKSPDTKPELGVLLPLKEGTPVSGEAVHLEHEGPGPLYRVSPLLEEGSSKVSSGAVSDEYRTGWDRTFLGRPITGQA
jgi:hypothetical protein